MDNIPAPFTKKQVDYFYKSLHSWFNVAEGGKRGGKNVLQTTAFCARLEKHPNRFHLIAGVSTASAMLNIIDCDGYGMINYFGKQNCRVGKYQNRDCIYVKTRNGAEKIVLVSGGRKDGDEKNIKGNTYGLAYITEANECHPKFVQEVFDRTMTSGDRGIYHDLNPKGENHPYYTDVLNFHMEKQRENPNYGFNYGHFTIADNLSVSDERLKEILATYDRKSIWYQRDILGMRRVAEGLVYPMFSTELHVTDGEGSDNRWFVSCDYGTINPTVFQLWRFDEMTCKSTCVRAYRHDSRKEKKQKTDEEYYADLETFVGGQYIEAIIIDPSAASFKETIRRHGKFRVRDADNSVLDGIRLMGTLLAAGYAQYNASCTGAIDEFGMYMWDDKSPEDAVIKEFDHDMDASRYYFQTIVRREVRTRGLVNV